MSHLRLGLLGVGTVGSGTIELLRRNARLIERRSGWTVDVVAAAVRDASRTREISLDGIDLSEDPRAVITNPDVDVVVELMGGIEPARTLVLEAIEHGKHVVTANKALIAMHGDEIMAAASERGAIVAFEAAVGGGIPVIKAIREALAGNRIDYLMGIINGTTNYILSEMEEKGLAFDDVLATAQSLGYAEADPTFDVDGIDAAHKLTILAALAFGVPLHFERFHVEGIRGIQIEDLEHAAELGYRIKHLAIARQAKTGIELRVHPTLVPQRTLLSKVDGVMNAVLVHGDAVGPTMFYGAGAGAGATASAVVADILDVIRAIDSAPGSRVPHMGFLPDHVEDVSLVPIEQAVCGHYLRIRVADEPRVLQGISGVLGDAEISIEAIHQPEPVPGADATVVLLTEPVSEAAIQSVVDELSSLPFVHDAIVRYRIASFD